MAINFNYTLAIPMVKALSLLTRDKTDQQIREALELHAIPRIRMYVLTAKDTSGKQVFYSALSDLSNSVVADKVEQLVDAVINEEPISSSIRRIAAALAASWLTIGDFSIIKNQQDMSSILEKQAMADLKRLTESEVLARGIEEALPGVISTSASVLYFTMDYDPSTYDSTTKTASQYVGVLEDGVITLSINGVSIPVSVSTGDTASVIVDSLAQAITAQVSGGVVNVTAGANEGPPVDMTRSLTSSDPITGLPKVTLINYSSNLSSLVLYPYRYDNEFDVATVSVSLAGDSGPGIKGLLLGRDADPSRLSEKGPYTIAVDLKTGQSSYLDAIKSTVSDSFFFEMTDRSLDSIGTLEDSTLTYRVNGGLIQTVDIPQGSKPQQLVELLAQDLATKANSQRILGAVRPSTSITVQGTSTLSPGLSFVSWYVEKTAAKSVFTLLTVPSGISFGVVPNTLISASTWDGNAKSVTIPNTISRLSDNGIAGVPEDTSTRGNVLTATHIPVGKLKDILDRFNEGPRS